MDKKRKKKNVKNLIKKTVLNNRVTILSTIDCVPKHQLNTQMLLVLAMKLNLPYPNNHHPAPHNRKTSFKNQNHSQVKTLKRTSLPAVLSTKF